MRADLESGGRVFTAQPTNSQQKNMKMAVGALAMCTVIFLFSPVAHSLGVPASATVNQYEPSGPPFKIAIVADLDKLSKVKTAKKPQWSSILKPGTLSQDFTISWEDDIPIHTAHGEAGRGYELSELVRYGKKLFTVDDRSGIVFELQKKDGTHYKSIPRYILMEGDGNTDKGMKAEWATTKDGLLYVGSFGKEFTTPDGTAIVNSNNMWVKTIDQEGRVKHVDWTSNFDKLRSAAGMPFPGYLLHEAALWSSVAQKWIFFPRRVSKERYDEVKDERRGSNMVILASEDFSDIEFRTIGTKTPTRGFSSAKFVPGTNENVVVALKSEENEEAQSQSSFITVFTLDGKVLLEETEVPGGHKYEGVVFL